MKIGAKRRRTRYQIDEQRRLEDERKKEIDAKLALFDNMQQQISVLEQSQMVQNDLNNAMEYLRKNGLLKSTGAGHFEAVASFEEA